MTTVDCSKVGTVNVIEMFQNSSKLANNNSHLMPLNPYFLGFVSNISQNVCHSLSKYKRTVVVNLQKRTKVLTNNNYWLKFMRLQTPNSLYHSLDGHYISSNTASYFSWYLGNVPRRSMINIAASCQSSYSVQKDEDWLYQDWLSPFPRFLSVPSWKCYQLELE